MCSQAPYSTLSSQKASRVLAAFPAVSWRLQLLLLSFQQPHAGRICCVHLACCVSTMCHQTINHCCLCIYVALAGAGRRQSIASHLKLTCCGYLRAGATAVSNEIQKAGRKSLAAVHSTADGGLSIHTVALTTSGTGQHASVAKLGLVAKDGAAVPVTNVFLADSSDAANQVVGVSASDGSFLAVQGKWTVCYSLKMPTLLHQ